MLVDLQSGMDPDEIETALSKKDDDEAATHNRKTRRLEYFVLTAIIQETITI